MWESLKRAPRGRISLRNFLMSFAMLLMATLLYSTSTSTSVNAAPGDAKWVSGAIVYDGRTHTLTDVSGASGLDEVPPGVNVYVTVQNLSTVSYAHVIFFAQGDDPSSAKQATYIRYVLNPPDTYSRPTTPQQIPVDPSGAPTSAAAASTQTSCDVDGIGWIICPLSKYIAEGLDWMYGIVAEFLNVAPLTTSDGSLYTAWKFMRNIANLSFVLAFLVIIYYYLVGTVDAKYGIRTIVPRIVIVAVLVNVSYWIVAVAVDVSNILGYSVQEMFLFLRDQIGAANSLAATEADWQTVTAIMLGGSVAGYAAFAGFAGATAIGGASMSFALIAALIPAMFAVFVAFIILAARQALITIFIIIAPLAFVAYLLPNTEEWFTRWRKFFTSLLIMFPAFSALFGGAQLAGVIIIQNAPNSNFGIVVVLLGLLVQVIPLFITPFLIRLSSGLLSTIAGMANDRSKGVFDRSKNWAKDRQDYHKQRVMGRQNPGEFRRMGNYYGMKQHHRERMKSAYQAQAEANYDNSRRGQRSYAEGQYGDNLKETARQQNEELYQRRVAGDVRWGDRSFSERYIPGQAEAQDNRYNQLRHELHEGHAAGVRAGIIKDSIHDEGEREVREQISTAANGSYYGRIRERQQQSVVDKGVADMYKGRVEAIGEQQFREEVAGSRALTRVVTETHAAKKSAEEYNTIVQKAAERSWNEQIVADGDAQSLYLRARNSEQGAVNAEKALSMFVERTMSKGRNAQGLAAGNEVIADSLRDLTVEVAAREEALENIKNEQRGNLLKKLNEDQRLLELAGGDTQFGPTKVLAKTQSAMTQMHLENVKHMTSIYSNDGYRVDEMLDAMQRGELRNHAPADEVAQQAAVQYVMESIGNNWSVQKIIDWADTQGMEMAKDANDNIITDANGEPIYYDAQSYRAAKRNGTLDQLQALDKSEVSRRRDMLQMVVGGYRNGKNKVSYAANTLLEKMNRGLSTTEYNKDLKRDLLFSESAILTESRNGKYEAERFATADPDELSRMIQVFREPLLRKQVTPEQRQKILEKISEAQTSELTRTRIKSRERGLMNVLASYLELEGDNPDQSQLLEMESSYYEQLRDDGNGNQFYVRVPATMAGEPGVRRMETSTMAPNVYDYTRQDDIGPSGVGLRPPRRRP